MKTLLIIIAISILSACATSNPAREKALNNFALSYKDRQLIHDRQIRTGMTSEMVIASWGPWCKHCYGTRRTSRGYSVEYNVFGSSYMGRGGGTILYFDNNDILQYWRKAGL